MSKKTCKSRENRTTHRYVTWQTDEADHEAQHQRARRDRRVDKGSGPSVEKLQTAIIELLAPLERHRRDRAREIADPDERAIKFAVADPPDSPEPRYGALGWDIIYAMQDKFPGLPDDVIRDALDELERKGEIYQTDDQSFGKAVKVWRVRREPASKRHQDDLMVEEAKPPKKSRRRPVDTDPGPVGRIVSWVVDHIVATLIAGVLLTALLAWLGLG